MQDTLDSLRNYTLFSIVFRTHVVPDGYEVESLRSSAKTYHVEHVKLHVILTDKITKIACRINKVVKELI